MNNMFYPHSSHSCQSKKGAISQQKSFKKGLLAHDSHIMFPIMGGYPNSVPWHSRLQTCNWYLDHKFFLWTEITMPNANVFQSFLSFSHLIMEQGSWCLRNIVCLNVNQELIYSIVSALYHENVFYLYGWHGRTVHHNRTALAFSLFLTIWCIRYTLWSSYDFWSVFGVAPNYGNGLLDQQY